MNELLYLRKKLQEDLEQREFSIAEGQCKNFEQYKQWVGECTGFRLSISHINNLLKNYEDIEDADNE